MAVGRATPKAPLAVERFVKQLYITYKAVKLYPPSSNIPRENAGEALALLRTLFQREPEVRLGVNKDSLAYESTIVYPDNPTYAAFARELYNRKLAEVRFHSGVHDVEITEFLALLLVPADELASSGGVEGRLWDQQVDNITVKEVATKIVDGGAVPAMVQAGEEWPPTSKRIDDILAGAAANRPRDQRLLVRVMEDRDTVKRYLKESISGRGARPDQSFAAGRVAAIAHVIANELPHEQAALGRTLIDAVLALDEPERGRLLRDKLLPDARNDEALAALLRSADLEELCEALVAGLVEGHASRDGLARAIRNLAMIGVGDREHVIGGFETALQAAGADQAAIASVLEEVSPTTLRVRERNVSAAERPVESIIKLIDLAPARERQAAQDEAVQALIEEAHTGITDGDVLNAYVNVLVIEQRPEQFASMMSLIEDGLELLLERGEFEVGADVAAALTEAEDEPQLDAGQRRRIRAAIDTLAKPAQMRHVNDAMRLYKHDTSEYQACHRLLGILGGHAIGPLLEVLAEEPDMSARKALVDLLSGMAANFVDELGDRVTDTRWYFVRNVVSILANVHDPRVLQHLNRTLRYHDSRVRRETIRAIASVKDRLAHEMLIAALEDEDVQNVQLAARYLGTLKARGGVDALLQVARGDGRGNRDLAARIEAIESLGRIGSSEAVETLEAIVRQRAILGRGPARELKTAAEAAIARITIGGSGQ